MAQCVCILGMGYVGLTLAVRLAEVGLQVTGVDCDPSIVAGLNSGSPHFHEVGLAEELRRHLGQSLSIRDRLPALPHDVYIIAVATPLDRETQRADVTFLREASRQIARHAPADALVIVRSTVPVGASREVVLPELHQAHPTIALATCPERTLEGAAMLELRRNPQIIGGLDQVSQERAATFFSKLVPTIVRLSSLEAAEAVKMADNCYRDVNFAIANEIALACEHLGLDAWEVIEAANVGYARNRIADPGFVGGPCLTKDPYLLAFAARQAGFECRLGLQARSLNESLPALAVKHIEEALRDLGKNLSSAKVLLTGVAFKGEPETDDLRGSEALRVAALLRQAGFSNVVAHDFVADAASLAAEGLTPVGLEEGFANADAIMILNNHAAYRKSPMRELLSSVASPAVLYDAWNMVPREMTSDLNVRHLSIGRNLAKPFGMATSVAAGENHWARS